MANYEKITRDQVVTYLNTTPSGTSETWALLGQGITSYGIEYNPQVTTEKFIINKNATSSLDSYQMQGDVSQKIYKGDPCFEYVNDLRRSLELGAEVETQVLDIDTYDTDTKGNYKATKSNCMIAITKYMEEEAVIEYSIYYNGDPVEGTVAIASTGIPTFTENSTSTASSSSK